MARRGGLGQRGLDLLIAGSPGDEREKEASTGAKESSGQKGASKKTAGQKKSTNKTAAQRTTAEKAADGKATAKKKTSRKGVTGQKAGVGKGSEQKTPATGKEKDIDNTNSSNANANSTSAKNKTAYSAELTADTSPQELPLSLIEPNREQPRKNFDEDSLQELADSIRTYGVLQPLVVQKREDYYEIIAGERRWRASKIAGLKQVPVVIKDYTPREIMEISLIENIQREDLNPIEEAAAYQRLMEEYGLRQDEVAERVSRSRAAVANAVRLLHLDRRVQEMVVSDMLSTGHARALLALTDAELQYKTAQRVFDEKLSVREVERLVKKLLAAPQEKARKPAMSAALEALYGSMEEQMKATLGTKVTIASKSPQKGRIEIEYYSSDELERIYQILRTPVREGEG